jgi:hypothetical protein
MSVPELTKPEDTTSECALPDAVPPAVNYTCDPNPGVVLDGTNKENEEEGCNAESKIKYNVTHSWIARDSCGNLFVPVAHKILVQDTFFLPSSLPPQLAKLADATLQCEKDVM